MKTAFTALVRVWGEPVTVRRDGVLLGEGRAILRPLLDKEAQFVPTDQGLSREERVLCLVESALPMEPVPGETVLTTQEETDYTVVSVRPLFAGASLVCWRAILKRREEAAE